MGIAERKEREKEKRREDILNAAEAVFFSKGFENTKMEEVAEKAEVSKGTVYLYFKSKEDLQFGVLQKGASILQEMLEAVISESKSGLENLLEMGRAFILFSEHFPNHFDLFLFFQVNDYSKLNIDRSDLQSYFINESPYTLLVKIVRKGIEDGSLRQDVDAEVFSTTLWSMMMGVMIVLKNKKELHEVIGINQSEILSTNFEILVNGGRNHA